MIDAIINIPAEAWDVLCDMAPYLLFGFLMAGVLSVLISAAFIERHLGGSRLSSIVKASAFGVPLPLCSCGVIPVAASLRKHGASNAATASFLLSTPQTGVDSVMVTLSLLGPFFAVFRPVVAFVTGVVGGLVVAAVGPKGSAQEHPAPPCQDACCAPGSRGDKLKRILSYGFLDLPAGIGKALLVGIVIAGAISALVPEGRLGQTLGTGLVAMLVMMAAGIPVYVCSTASVPIAASLIAKGISPGAALAFLMTGPATNAATIATVWKIMGRRVAVAYLGTVAVMAMASGLLLDNLLVVRGAAGLPRMPAMLAPWVRTVSAIVLLIVLVSAIVRTRRQPHAPASSRSRPRGLEMRISGMTCAHCAAAVREALAAVEGVENVEVDLKRGTAVVIGNHLAGDALTDAVERLGYEVKAPAGNQER